MPALAPRQARSRRFWSRLPTSAASGTSSQATEALTRFADAAVRAAVAFLLRKHARAGLLALDRGRAPILRAARASSCWRSASMARANSTIRATSTSSSSTTPRRRRFLQGTEPGPLFVRLTKALARLLQERTGDGYVLRVDLRLRPDPGLDPGRALDCQRLSPITRRSARTGSAPR